ncbi:MAG: His/Gly/Thr/Pro-type tRNA ligase C-terminal domain-containing protein, partial [Nanoarchaeota archaeon]
IKFLNKEGKEEFAYQNTYAITTRMLGVMFAIHSDEKGLILPPKIAPNQIVIIPILLEDSKTKVLKVAREIEKELEEFSPKLDDREEYRPGFKFNEYELKGIPLRIEIGPRDLEKNEVVIVRRDTKEKKSIKISELKTEIPRILEDIQRSLFNKSKKLFESKIEGCDSLDKLKLIIENKKIGICPVCKEQVCEDNLKSETGGAKALFISDKHKVKAEKCIICKKKADYFVYIAKTY